MSTQGKSLHHGRTDRVTASIWVSHQHRMKYVHLGLWVLLLPGDLSGQTNPRVAKRSLSG